MKVFFREIDAAEFVVFVGVTDDVGELEGEAEVFREVQGARIAEAEDVSAGKTYRAGHAIAVFAETFERWIGLNGKVHLGAADEVMKIARGHFVTLHGVYQRGKDFRRTIQG